MKSSLIQIANARPARPDEEAERGIGAEAFDPAVQPGHTDRRGFLKALGLAGAGAAASGCSQTELLPYVVPDERRTPGEPASFATVCRECPAGCGMLVRTHDGRATKVEGHPSHPINRGKLCIRGQSSLQGIYNPDRFDGPRERDAHGAWRKVSWEAALARLAAEMAQVERENRAGEVAWLGGLENGALGALIDDWLRAWEFAPRLSYEPLSYDSLRLAAQHVFGSAIIPGYNFAPARYLISFGAEFLETWLSNVEYTLQFSAMHSYGHTRHPARFVFAAPRLNLTGANADENWQLAPGSEALAAYALAALTASRLGRSMSWPGGMPTPTMTPAAAAAKANVPLNVLQRAAWRLSRRRPSLILGPGAANDHDQAAVAHGIVLRLNQALGNVGVTVLPDRPHALSASAWQTQVLELLARARQGGLRMLFLHHANPAFHLPAVTQAITALEKIPFIVSFARHMDESTEHAHLILPDHDPLESWGDYAPRPGIAGLMQPAMRPVFNTRPTGDILLWLGRHFHKKLPGTETRAAAKSLLPASSGVIAGGAAGAAGAGPPVTLGMKGEIAKVTPAPEAASSPKLTESQQTIPTPEGSNLPASPNLAQPDPDDALPPASVTNFDEYLRRRWQQALSPQGDAATQARLWRHSLAQGVWAEAGVQVAPDPMALTFVETHSPLPAEPLVAPLPAGIAAPAAPAAAPTAPAHALPADGMANFAGAGEYYLLLYPAIQFYDGRLADRGWCQEIPDPLSKITWDNYVELHPATAAALGVAEGDLLRLETESGSAEFPAHLQTWTHPAVLAISMAQGHRNYGRFASHRGDWPQKLAGARLADGWLPGFQAKASARRLEKHRNLADLQPERLQWDKKIALAVELAQADTAAAREPERRVTWYSFHPYPNHRWAMAIDLDSCIGCNACVAACYAENNIPVMGRSSCLSHREMAWLRVELYAGESSHPSTQMNPDLRFIPIPCQQCDNAPCEYVCPVYAAYHTDEGLNGQVYNRCIGTRYCSNNCIYKVRRFNWYTPQWPAPLDQQLNPEVTVRGKGVMEKCTFCVQRIQRAELTAKVDKRPLQDGEIQPACMQTCPTEAIVFGDAKDPNSRVSQLARQPRGYHMFYEENTFPAVTYLKRVKFELNQT